MPNVLSTWLGSGLLSAGAPGRTGGGTAAPARPPRGGAGDAAASRRRGTGTAPARQPLPLARPAPGLPSAQRAKNYPRSGESNPANRYASALICADGFT